MFGKAAGIFPLAGAALVIALLTCPVFAQQSQGGSDAASAEPPSAKVTLSTAEDLRLRFSEYPNLNGDYKIDPARSITIPVLGRFPLDQLGTSGLEEAIRQKAASVTGAQIHVTVEVVKYRPLYVVGRVSKPGAVEWQPGLTVRQATAAAGGIVLALSSGSTTDASQIKKSIDNQKRALAAYARAKAERDNSAVIAIPQRLLALVSEAEAKGLIDAQTDIMLARRAARQSQLASIKRTKEIAQQELEALKQQRHSIDQSLGLRQQHSERINELFRKGLAVADTALQQKIELSQLEEKAANLSVAIARVQATVAELDEKANNAESSQQLAVEEELLKLESSIAQNAIDLEGVMVQQAKSPSDAALPYLYTVARAEALDAADSHVDLATPLMPGDVLTVSQNLGSRTN